MLPIHVIEVDNQMTQVLFSVQIIIIQLKRFIDLLIQHSNPYEELLSFQLFLIIKQAVFILLKFNCTFRDGDCLE